VTAGDEPPAGRVVGEETIGVALEVVSSDPRRPLEVHARRGVGRDEAERILRQG
jgi:hypothetical protein